MKYFMKTFFPLPLSRACFEDSEDLISRLNYIMDYTEEFYRQKGVDVDLERYIDIGEGYRVFSINQDKMTPKLKKFITTEMQMTFTKPMYEFEKYRTINA